MWCPSFNKHQASEWLLTPDPFKHAIVGWSTCHSLDRYWIERFFKSIYIDTLAVSISFLNRLSLNKDMVVFNSSCLMPLPIELLKKYHLPEVNFFLHNEKILLPVLKYLTSWPSTVPPYSSFSAQYLCQERRESFSKLPLTLTRDCTVIYLCEKERKLLSVALLLIEFFPCHNFYMSNENRRSMNIIYFLLKSAVNFPCLFIPFLFILRALVMQWAELNQRGWLFP